MRWFVQSPVATRCEPRAEADYRMNGVDWKGTDTTFESRYGNVMNLQSDYRFGHTTAYTCKGTQPETYIHTPTPLSDRNIWTHAMCTFLQQVKIKVLTHAQLWTHVMNNWWGGYSLGSHLSVKYKRLAYTLSQLTLTHGHVCICIGMMGAGGLRQTHRIQTVSATQTHPTEGKL